MNRRQFLQRGGAFMLAGLAAPALWRDVALAAEKQDRVLVMIQLLGGNDGLNAFVPYSDAAYYKARPTIAVPRDQVYPLDDHLGLHPSLARLYPHFQHGNMAVVQGVGYPHRTRSHFISTDIWQSARTPPTPQHGWLGRVGELALRRGGSPLKEMAYGTLMPMALLGDNLPCGCIDHLEQFAIESPVDSNRQLQALQQMYRTVDRGDMERVRLITEASLASVDTMQRLARTMTTKVKYPATPFAQFLRMAAEMTERGLGPRVFHAGIGGFDTHSKQRKEHDRVLRVLGDGLAAFLLDLQVRGLDERVLVATYSEFGRRVAENGSEGTDHGQAAPQLIVGSPVRGGIYGPYPDLSHLEDGDIPFAIDFRSLYATLLEKWIRIPSESILGGRYPTLPVLD